MQQAEKYCMELMRGPNSSEQPNAQHPKYYYDYEVTKSKSKKEKSQQDKMEDY